MYQLTTHDTIIRFADNAHIPIDDRNRDYQAYLAWLAEGNTPLPAPEEPPSVAAPTLQDRVELLEDVVQELLLEGVPL